MRILFLDFDGVLNNMTWMTRPRAQRLVLPDQDDLDPANLAELAYISASVPDMRVVVSSTWRIGLSLGELCRMLIAGGLGPRRVMGVTPRLSGQDRGHEIEAWLQAQPLRPAPGCASSYGLCETGELAQ